MVALSRRTLTTRQGWFASVRTPGARQVVGWLFARSLMRCVVLIMRKANYMNTSIPVVRHTRVNNHPDRLTRRGYRVVDKKRHMENLAAAFLFTLFVTADSDISLVLLRGGSRSASFTTLQTYVRVVFMLIPSQGWYLRVFVINGCRSPSCHQAGILPRPWPRRGRLKGGKYAWRG